jgi:hypothetical protein
MEIDGTDRNGNGARILTNSENKAAACLPKFEALYNMAVASSLAISYHLRKIFFVLLMWPSVKIAISAKILRIQVAFH